MDKQVQLNFIALVIFLSCVCILQKGGCIKGRRQSNALGMQENKVTYLPLLATLDL